MKIVLSTYATLSSDTDAWTSVHNVPVTEWDQLTRSERIATAARIAAADLSATKCWTKATSYGWTLTVDGALYAEGDEQLTPTADPYDVMRAEATQENNQRDTDAHADMLDREAGMAGAYEVEYRTGDDEVEYADESDYIEA